MTTARKQGIFFAVIILMGLLALAPRPAQAVGLAGDIMCGAQYCYPGKCVPSPRDPACVPCQTIRCPDNTNGFTTPAKCVSSAPGKCQAIGAAGGDQFGLQLVQQVLGSLFQKLMQGSQGSGSGSGSGAGTSATGPTGCGSYQATSDINQVSTSNTGGVCYYYQAPVSSQLDLTTTGAAGGTGTSISDQLNTLTGTSGDTSTTVSTDTPSNTDTNTNTTSNTNTVSSGLNQLTAQVTPTVVSSAPATSTVRTIIVPSGAIGGLTSGVSGDIKLLGNGGTILAGSVDSANNSVTAGFFGSNTYTGQPTSVIANLCRSRPRASNFLSYVLPPTFFDSLCALRGYQVGTPQPVVPTVTIVQSAPRSSSKPAGAASTTPAVPPKVEIWAVPASVPLGSRTSIFWNSQGVTNCFESSPDGSFSQNSLSGGASTVALTGATTFTISCIAPDGSHVTNYLTGRLSI